MQKIKISSKNKMEAKEFPDNDKKIPFTQRVQLEEKNSSVFKVPKLSKAYIDTNSLFKKINNYSDTHKKSNDIPNIDTLFRSTNYSEFKKQEFENHGDSSPLFVISNINPIVPKHIDLMNLKQADIKHAKMLNTHRENFFIKKKDKKDVFTNTKISRSSNHNSHSSLPCTYKNLIHNQKQSMPDLSSGINKRSLKASKPYDPFANTRFDGFSNSPFASQTQFKDPNKIKKGRAGLKRLGIQYKNEKYFNEMARDSSLVKILMKEEKREKMRECNDLLIRNFCNFNIKQQSFDIKPILNNYKKKIVAKIDSLENSLIMVSTGTKMTSHSKNPSLS